MRSLINIISLTSICITINFAFAEDKPDTEVVASAFNNLSQQLTGSEISLEHSPRFAHELYTGFYPLVEETGYVASNNTWRIGFNQVGLSFLNRFSIATQPMLYAANTPNVLTKGQLYVDSRQALALGIGVNMLLPGTDDFFSAFYSSRVFNPNSTLYVVPVTLAHSYKINSFIQLHHSLTDINVFSRTDFKNKANLAYSAVLQLKARQNHSLMLHATEVGFWDHDYYYYGISYRYSGKQFFTQIGYFNRTQLEGVQGTPLFDIGFLL